jgi:hypothetical protein
MPAADALHPAAHPQVLAVPNPFGAGSDQVTKWVVAGISKAINRFFGDLVTSALDPLLKLLGQTLLTTPEVSSLPRIGQLWENSRQLAVAVYALIIVVAGIVVMAYETVHTRQGIKEIAPRIVLGFLAWNMSLLLAGKAVTFANALSTGVLSQGADARPAAGTLTALVMNAITHGGAFVIFIGLGLALILLALLVGYVIRVALTVILIAGAPLALMCHALPQTEGIARWWWRAFGGVLAIQLAQSLALVTAINVFLAQGGFTFFGSTGDGLVNLIVTLALLYILYKIPFWILHSIQVSGGRSIIGGAIKGLIAYKTLGLVGLRRPSSGAGFGRGGGPRRPGGPAGPGGPGGSPRRPPRPSGPAPAGGATSRRPHTHPRGTVPTARPRPHQPVSPQRPAAAHHRGGEHR